MWRGPVQDLRAVLLEVGEGGAVDELREHLVARVGLRALAENRLGAALLEHLPRALRRRQVAAVPHGCGSISDTHMVLRADASCYTRYTRTLLYTFVHGPRGGLRR